MFGNSAQILPSDDPKWPLYGDLLTLPLVVGSVDLVPVTWFEGGYTQTRNYYQMRAWFNRLPSKTNSLPADNDAQYEKVKVMLKSYSSDISRECLQLLECVIFVAEEFIHPRYRFGPPMANQHLLNVPTRVRLDAGGNTKALSLEDAMKNDGYQSWELGWARLTIDEEFYYGQSSDTKASRRWIVYHPRREAYHGRFVVDGKQQWLETVAAALPTVKVAGVNIFSMDASNAQALGKLVIRMAGDPLRQFVSPAALTLLDPGTAKKGYWPCRQGQPSADHKDDVQIDFSRWRGFACSDLLTKPPLVIYELQQDRFIRQGLNLGPILRDLLDDRISGPDDEVDDADGAQREHCSSARARHQ